jgi:hypothetical protein
MADCVGSALEGFRRRDWLGRGTIQAGGGAACPGKANGLFRGQDVGSFGSDAA